MRAAYHGQIAMCYSKISICFLLEHLGLARRLFLRAGINMSSVCSGAILSKLYANSSVIDNLKTTSSTHLRDISHLRSVLFEFLVRCGRGIGGGKLR
jgi:hypothetical protein